MKAVIQRVLNAEIHIDGSRHSRIENGLLVLLGIHADDASGDADWLISKILQMRIFNNAAGKMDYNLIETNGEIMVVSQFTLFASTKKGNRPSFSRAAMPSVAIPLYEYFLEQLKNQKLQSGIFGADMQVSLTNDGPVTILLDSRNRE